ncbi:hypothetical protein CNR22_22265 [Sphingobacteriaceae bacterium]|nr:hypothetical protein CNR22_22265 [Sphingobacteriaceae bacterium]
MLDNLFKLYKAICIVALLAFTHTIRAQAGAALNFDSGGSADNILLPQAISTNYLVGNNKITVEAWVRPTSVTGLGCIVGNYGTPFNQVQFMLRRDYSYYTFSIGSGVGTTSSPAGTALGTASTNVWQHVAATYDGTLISIYINGVLSGSAVGSYTFAATTNSIILGTNSISESFDGDIDEVRIWNTSRMQCEISSFKDCEIPTSYTNLIANYHFNQGLASGSNSTVTTLVDASGNLFSGTLNTFSLTGSTSNWVGTGGVVSGATTTLAPISISITASPSLTVCSGNTLTLAGAGATNYTWTGSISNAAAFTPTANNTYSVIGTNTLTGCSNSAVATVSVKTSPSITVNSATICSGSSVTITPVSTGINAFNITGGNFTVTPSTTTSYSVTGTGTNGCVSSNTAVSTVSVNTTPTITVNSATICSGNSVTITPVSPVITAFNITGGSFTVTPSTTTSYSVTGTGTNGCVSSNTAVSTVSVNTTPTITVNSATICSGNSVTITPVSTGITAFYITGGSFTVTPSTTTSYSVTGTGTNGCVSSNTAVSTVSVNTTPTITVNSATICSGNSVTITPVSTGITAFNITGGSFTVTPSTTTSYSVTGTGTNGCVSSNTAVSTVSVNTTPTITVNSATICSGNSVTITPVSTGITAFNITGGNFTVTPSTTTSYSVTGTGTNGCAASNTAVSTVYVNANPTITVNSGTICAGQSFTIVPAGANTYTIQGGSTVVNPTIMTSYTVTGVSSLGCLSTNTVTSHVHVNTLPAVNAGSGKITICKGESTILSADGALTYVWSTSENTNTISISPTITTIYTVTGTDANGCVNTSTVSQDVSECTGIENRSQLSSSVKIFPNPSTGAFTTQFEFEGTKEILILNEIGQTLEIRSTENQSETFDITKHGNGIYFIKVRSNVASGNFRVIVQ